MGRSTSLLSALARASAADARRVRQLQKQALNQQEAAERARKRAESERRQRLATDERERKRFEKEAKEQFIRDQLQETDDKNADLAKAIDQLNNVLQHTFSIDDTIQFSSLKITEPFAKFITPFDLKPGQPPLKTQYTDGVKPMSTMEKALGMKGRYQREMTAAEQQFASALNTYKATEAEKSAKLDRLMDEYEASKRVYLEKVRLREIEVDELQAAYNAGDVSAIITYNTMVLERSEYPDDFPQKFRLAYVPESKQLVVEYELPGTSIVPSELEFKYNKSKDVIDFKPRKSTEIKAVYQDVIAAITLRTIHEIFEADQGKHIEVVVFNGFVESVDLSTGKDISPCIVSARATRDQFSELNLARVDKKACLRNLGAPVSSQPDELLPVKPIVEFNMVDKRFVEQNDILSDLESRPNLMDLSPTEFENLVSNLFGKMGLETKLTRASRDGGVDAVAFDPRPVLGGKVVIQAKRYKNTVGVSAVRDLFGTLMNEGASKGILVATSGYGTDAYEFAKDKPLELIDGGGLLYLLDQIGFKARIIMPVE